MDQRWKMGPEVLKAGETLETTLSVRRDAVRLTETEEMQMCRNRKWVRQLADPFPAWMETVPVRAPGEQQRFQTLHQVF